VGGCGLVPGGGKSGCPSFVLDVYCVVVFSPGGGWFLLLVGNRIVDA
jgi:hypothetical protein